MLLIGGQISFIRSMADGGWRLIIDIGENPPLEELNKCTRKAVFIGISLAELSDKEQAILLEATEMQTQETHKENNHFFDD